MLVSSESNPLSWSPLVYLLMKPFSFLSLTFSFCIFSSLLPILPAISETEPNLITFKCDDGTSFTGQFFREEAIFNLPGQGEITLPQVVSASGAKYTDDNITVWTKGQEAFVEVDNQITLKNCLQVRETLTENVVASPSPLADTSWRLVSWGEEETKPLESSEITLEFTEDRLAGSSGCNRYTSGYTVSDQVLNVSLIASTRMACSPEIMQQEFTYLKHLQAAVSHKIDEQGQLIITYQIDQDSGMITFEPVVRP